MAAIREGVVRGQRRRGARPGNRQLAAGVVLAGDDIGDGGALRLSAAHGRDDRADIILDPRLLNTEKTLHLLVCLPSILSRACLGK